MPEDPESKIDYPGLPKLLGPENPLTRTMRVVNPVLRRMSLTMAILMTPFTWWPRDPINWTAVAVGSVVLGALASLLMIGFEA